VALSDGTLVRGDVEIHVRASSWMRHGHARDAAYQHVVLHVVGLADAMAVTLLGSHVPTVQLEPWRGPPPVVLPPRSQWVPCVRSVPAVLSVVRAAGQERFRARQARFEGDLALVEADQVLWRGVCEALGFRRNAEPFGRLADAVPWAEAATAVVERGPVGLAGLLLGRAGLLAEATLPEAHAWRALQRRCGLRQALGVASWDQRQLRAANAPAVRCRGLAALAQRWTQPRWSGPAERVLEAVKAAAASRRPGLWGLVQVPPWIGRGRAQVVAINVLLPFAAAAGVAEASALYERLPGEPTNRVVRYMAAQLGNSVSAAEPVRFRGALLQQGLLQLFKQTCAARLCERCPARRPGGPSATSVVCDSSNG
jgi:hypothetical protein